MDSRIEAFLEDKFQEEEAEKIKAFINRGFCLNGQIAVVSVFAYAQEYEKSIDEALAACEAEWEKNWDFQHPDFRGDPDAPGKAGFNNLMSLEDIYLRLGIPSLLQKK